MKANLILLLALLYFGAIKAQVPTEPYNLDVTGINSGGMIQFTAPTSIGSSSITNYEYSTDDGANWITASPAITESPLIINSGLNNCTTYKIKLRAVNDSGSGTASTAADLIPSTSDIGVNWYPRNAASSNNWNSITYGKGLFVAVASTGSGNRVMTSPDGVTWTSTIVGNSIWISVTYGNGLFMAVSSNRVMISPDGINWTVSTTPLNGLSSVTYGNGHFVVVSSTGSGSQVMTSSDGIAWTTFATATNNWRSVTYGNGLFVAVASSGVGNRVMTNSDGENWTPRNSAQDNSWRSVTYGNGLFVAVANTGLGNRVMTSPDGITWTSRTSVDNNWSSVTCGSGLFVAVATSGVGNRVMTSPDGINWTSRNSIVDSEWSSVTYGEGLFVAVANFGTGNRVMTSSFSPSANAPVITSTTIIESTATVNFSQYLSALAPEITNYEYSTNNGSSWTALSPAAISSPLIISLPSSTSTIMIRAVNSIGVSCPSNNYCILPTLKTTSISAYGSYIWNGATYTESGIYTGNTANCVTEQLDLTINPLTFIWTGTGSTTDWHTADNWSCKIAPLASSDVIINAGATQPTISTNVAIHSLTIDINASLTVQKESNLTVTNYIHNSGTLTIENNANLIQVDDVANTGNTIVKRNSSPLLRSDYTLWSSPVFNQNIFVFSPATLTNRFYEYNSAFGKNGAYSSVSNPSATNFTVGKGYLIRMPNNANATTPAAYPSIFTGVLNNGDVPVSLTSGDADHSYNLVGNPYPSPISISTFLADNAFSIESTLYFWRKTNEGSGSAYCTVNNETFVTNNNSNSVDPNGIIQTGQGFFVMAKPSATSLTFKNGQRIANTANQFFKTKQAETPSRIWLNATNAIGSFSQMAINYTQNATLGLDNFDGKYINDNPIALTSNINNEEYTIQGRPTFDPSDVVALNFKTDLAGNYTIALDHSDGEFALGQDVYLVDSKTGTEINLKTDAYTFAATTGIDNTRFSLKYQKTLKIDAPIFNENTVMVYKNKGTLIVKSTVNAIDNIKIFDLDGRLIAEQKKVNANSATIENLRANEQVLIVQVTSDDKKIVNKKVIN